VTSPGSPPPSVIPAPVAVPRLREVPDDSTWPRLMTGEHPRWAGSLGAECEEWALERPLMHLRGLKSLRWWQRLVLERALEVDATGALLWQTVIVSAPRQTGKSYLERIALAWRMSQAARFDGPQDCLHVAHKLSAAQEVWRPAARWAVQDIHNRVRWANGEQQIELADGSRWMIQAATDGAGVSFSLAMVLVDEAWRVHRHVVDAALVPTMAEAEQPQLWLVSTAGTSASDLMLAYRAMAMALDKPTAGDSVLLLEWSAPPDPDLDIDDPVTWRNATPYWDARRQSRVQKARDEQPEVAFRQQWLNQWVPTMAAPLFEPSAWTRMLWLGALPTGPLAFGVDVAKDRSHAVIVALCNGVAEVVERQAGAAWVPTRLVELVARWQPVAIGVDATGAAATVADQLRDTPADRLLVPLTGRQLASACGQVFDAISEERLCARANSHLEDAVLHATKRPYGQAWVFAGSNDGVSCVPLLALTAAWWAAGHQAEQAVERSQIW
jgi:hypothetical protein